jgi:hypothetical protein
MLVLNCFHSVARLRAHPWQNEIFDGDVEASMVQLRESIKCGEAWRAIYMRAVHAIQADTKVRQRAPA